LASKKNLTATRVQLPLSLWRVPWVTRRCASSRIPTVRILGNNYRG